MQRHQAGIRGIGQEGADLLPVLFRQHGAGGVEQGAAVLPACPEGIENAALQLGQLADVLIPRNHLMSG